jgi:hypothetical protein
MSKISKIIIQLFFVSLLSMALSAQRCDCITLDSSQKKLYLNGNNFTLIDNALRCFKLNSVAEQDDSIVRIWILETSYPDTPTTWRVKLFEFGKRGVVPFSILHILEWGYENDSSLPVKCIKHEKIYPINGWLAFEKDIRRLDLTALYKTPFINNGVGHIDFGMLIIQFLFGNTTYSVDFTGLLNLSDPINSLQLNHSKRIKYLLWYIKKHFSINLSIDSKGRDFLKGGMIDPNFNKENH